MPKHLAAAVVLALVAAACGSGTDAGTPEGAVLPVPGDGGGAGDGGVDPGSPASIPDMESAPDPQAEPATATPAPDAGEDPDPVSPDAPHLAATQPTLVNTETPSVPEEVAPSAPLSGPALAAVVDLAARLGVDSGTITVVSTAVVTWRDGSLGCPQPGMQYTQALVEGMRIELAHGGKTYHYHSGGNRPPFLCENPSK